MDSTALLCEADTSHLKFVIRRVIIQVAETVIATRASVVAPHLSDEAAEAACGEVVRRANFRASQLQLSLKWNEEQRRLLGEEVQRLQGCEALSADLERTNAKLRKENLQVQEVQQLRLDKLRLSAENVSQTDAVKQLQDARTEVHQRNVTLTEQLQHAEAVGANAESLAASSQRLKEQLKKTSARARMADGFEKSNAYLRQQVKTLKKERIASEAGRPRSVSPSSRSPSPAHARSSPLSSAQSSPSDQRTKSQLIGAVQKDDDVDSMGQTTTAIPAEESESLPIAAPEVTSSAPAGLTGTRNVDRHLREREQLARMLSQRSR